MKRVLFIGDSITDAERNREDPEDLGQGYVRIISENGLFLAVNRGISGQRVEDVSQRLRSEVGDIEPDAIVVYAGINNVVHVFKRQRPESPEEFRNRYEELVGGARACGKPLLFLLPFLLPTTGLMKPEPWRPVPETGFYAKWRAELEPRLAIMKDLLVNQEIPFIALDPLFQDLGIDGSPAAYSLDGVHPTAKGHQFIAQRVIDEMEELFS